MMNKTDLLPWSWSITPAANSSNCPSPSAILGTFAIVNIAVSILSIISGHRLIVRFCTWGYFGTKDFDSSWKYFWVVPLSMQLTANAVNAALIQRGDGYETTFPVGQLMLLFAVRPRLSWMVLLVLSVRGRKKENETVQEERDRRMYAISERHRPSHWRSSAMSSFLAEIAMEVISVYMVCRAVHHGSARGFYTYTGYYRLPRDAQLMYVGALWYLIAACLAVLWAVYYFGIKSYVNGSAKKDKRYDHGDHALMVYFWLMIGLVWIWTASWIFWAGYLKVAGERYCPPNLMEQGTVWIVFSVVGIVFGTGP